MCAFAIRSGTQTVGDFVFINAMMMQLFVPLNFIGFVYREIRQALTDIEKMFDLLERPAEIRDAPGAKPLAVTSGNVASRTCVLPTIPTGRS